MHILERYRMGKNKNGFTIVELLVVIVIVGILAAIVFVSYSGIKSKAVGALLVSNLNNVSKSLSIYKIENDTYPTNLDSLNNGSGVQLGNGVTIQEYYYTSDSFCINALSDGINYRLVSGGEPRLGQCARPTKDRFSQIKWANWAVGIGLVTDYSRNGDGNSIIIDTNPWGEQDIMWDVSNQDATSDADGGWVTSSFAIDNTKTYRFSVFVRRKVIGDGRFYLGLYSYPDPALARNNGTATTNPYFHYSYWWGSAGDWYLVTGHVWPSGSGVGQSKSESGIYDMNGNKLSSTVDYVWPATATTARHRSYLFNSIDTSTNQQFYQPRVDIIDGSEPTINELLKNSF